MKKIIILIVLGLVFSNVVLARGGCMECAVEVSTDAEQMVEEVPNVDPEPIGESIIPTTHRRVGNIPAVKPDMSGM